MATTLHINDRGPAVKKLQVEINKTLNSRRFPWRTIETDSDFGDKTRQAARFAAWLMGMTGDPLKRISEGTITPRTFDSLTRAKPPTEAMKARQRERLPTMKKLRFLHHRQARKLKRAGQAVFDDVPVAAWMVKFLQKSRDNGWQGVVVSGFRTPEHSDSLCRAICGQPSCPGRCAGRASNHVGLTDPGGAIDVTDTDRFAAIQRKIGSPLRNDLPNDPVHFSVSGH